MQAVLFDLDGTLINSIGVWKRVDEKVLSKYGIKLDEDYHNEIKMLTYIECIEYIIKKFEIKKTVEEMEREFTEAALYEYSHNITLKKGAEKFVEKLKDQNIKTAVVTSCRRDMCMTVLENNKISKYFDEFIFCDEVGIKKDNSDIYKYAAKILNVKPENCIVFEDVGKAAESAARAGMTVYGIEDDESCAEKKILSAVCNDLMRDFNNAYEKITKYA